MPTDIVAASKYLNYRRQPDLKIGQQLGHDAFGQPYYVAHIAYIKDTGIWAVGLTVVKP